MKKNKVMLTVGIALALALAISFFIVMLVKKDESTNETTNSSGSIHLEQIETEPMIDFEKGNEVYFDESIQPYLESLKLGYPVTDENGNFLLTSDGLLKYGGQVNTDFEPMLNTLVIMINKMAKDGYPISVGKQMQRFYVQYWDRLTDYNTEDLYRKMTVCFPKSGANPETVADLVLSEFGIMSSDMSFVFHPFLLQKYTARFYAVLPPEIKVSEDEAFLCIYETWKSAEDDGYERNLHGWLHQFIHEAYASHFDDQKVLAAQLLYIGSLADTEYNPDWKDKLITCLSVETWNYESFKAVVENEFHVSIDNNTPLREYFGE